MEDQSLWAPFNNKDNASVSTTPRLNPNSVKSLIQEPFERRSLADKLQVKDLGPDQPDIVIKQQDSEKG
ncbi:hypothetical protein NQZ68_031266 [Dissostichus eleginoides]|nr:hypothetical protein NQZ68_031266 [Dissostichus eleginoides]